MGSFLKIDIKFIHTTLANHNLLQSDWIAFLSFYKKNKFKKIILY